MTDAGRQPPFWRGSLRAKGLLGTLALLLYLGTAVAYVSWERAQLYDSMQRMDGLTQHERALVLTESAVSNALVDVSDASSAAHATPPDAQEMALYMETCSRLFDTLSPFDPAYELLKRSIERSYAAVAAAPLRANWIDLRESLARASQSLEIRRQEMSAAREAQTAGYHRQYDAVTIKSLLLAIVGFVGFGSAAAWFFSGLARDVRRLEGHARQIVQGARGAGLDVTRQDELGHLMRAVNRMAVDLDERERRIELETQRRSHEDKMLTVGALAAGVAHEVNNPLAVIAGAAQELQAGAGQLPPEQVTHRARTILEATERAAQAARQLADTAAPQPAELDWVDLNAIVRHAVRLMGYDRRYRPIAFELVLDEQLPAVCTSASSVQQYLMQVLTLACGAQVAATTIPPSVGLRTTAAGDRAVLELGLNVPLDFTRAEVQRILLLSRTIVESIGGHLALGQDGETGQRIKLELPLPERDAKERKECPN